MSEDKGCEFAPSCLNCPFPTCLHELPGKKTQLRKRGKEPKRPTAEFYTGSDRFWPPRDIRFTQEQVFWLFQHMDIIREGNWPPRPSSYIEPNVQKSPSRHAPFEAPISIAAELLVRLENAGQDGAMCKLVYIYGEPVESIARHWHIPPWVAQQRIDRALHYCSGWKRKRTYRQGWSYSSWVKQRNYRAITGGGNPRSRVINPSRAEVSTPENPIITGSNAITTGK